MHILKYCIWNSWWKLQNPKILPQDWSGHFPSTGRWGEASLYFVLHASFQPLHLVYYSHVSRQPSLVASLRTSRWIAFSFFFLNLSKVHHRLLHHFLWSCILSCGCILFYFFLVYQKHSTLLSTCTGPQLKQLIYEFSFTVYLIHINIKRKPLF